MNKNIFLTLIAIVYICNLYSSQSGMTEQEIINYATNTPLKNIFEQKYSDIKQTKPIIDELYENKIAMSILELRIKNDPISVKRALESTEKSIRNMNNTVCNTKNKKSKNDQLIRVQELRDLYETLLDIAAQGGAFNTPINPSDNAIENGTSSMPPLEPLSNQHSELYRNFFMRHPYIFASAFTSACIGIYYLYHYQYIPTKQETIDNK